jgi:predicted DNA-binding WGR domain protein
MFFDEPEERALYYKNDKENSDKVYLLQIVESVKDPGKWIVLGLWGPRDSWGPNQRQVKSAYGRLVAEKIFNKMLESKLKKGYEIGPRHLLGRGYPSLTKSSITY